MRNNAPLVNQLRETMETNLEMAKNLNPKATQNPEYKKLVDKAKKNYAFEKNLDRYGY